MMEEYQPVLDRINKGYFTIGDLAADFKQFPQDELEETLEGFVAFNKIKKTRQFFHGNNIVPPEKKTRQHTGNSLDTMDVEYPEWVKTDRDKIKFLTSPESPRIAASRHFFIDDFEIKNTGHLIYDSLNSNHIMTSVYLNPNKEGTGNTVAHSKDVTQLRGVHVLFRDGVFKVQVSLIKPLQSKYANAKTDNVSDHFEKEFPDYESFKKWLVENL